MIQRVLTAALAVSLAIPSGVVMPSAAKAQRGPLFDQPAPPRIRLSPFVGHLNGVTRNERWQRQDADGVALLDARVHLADATGAGLVADALLGRHFGLSAGASAFTRGETVFSVTQTGDAVRTDGANLFLARLGLALHMPTEQSEFVLRRLEASVSAGGLAWLERPRNTLGTGDILGNSTQYGVNLALHTALPFGGDRFTVHAGVEDNITFWNEAALARLPRAYLGNGAGQGQTEATTSATHSWLLRAGMGFRFR